MVMVLIGMVLIWSSLNMDSQPDLPSQLRLSEVSKVIVQEFIFGFPLMKESKCETTTFTSRYQLYLASLA